jgi:polysaccharide deacetylase 2 family uncharacterized protein YibQ
MRRASWLVSLAVGGVAVLAGTAAASLVPRGEIRYIDVPIVRLPLSTLPESAGPVARPGLATLASPEPPREIGLPGAVDPALLESSAVGALPRIAADGRTPLRQYAHPTASACDRPCVGLIVTGLGLAGDVTTRALALPGLVGLSFSPYVDVTVWPARARRHGHEVLLDLPLQPTRYPRDDGGPLTVPMSSPGIEPALLRALAAGSGYVALAASAGAFAGDPASFAPVAQMLRQRGLGFVELSGGNLGRPAQAESLPYVVALGPIEADPSPAAIDGALAAVEAAALHGGAALAFSRPTPVSLDRLAHWLETLPGKGLLLVPPSRLLERSDGPQAAAGR